MTRRLSIHVLGSRPRVGYTTLSATDGLGADDRSELEVLSVAGPKDADSMARLEREPVMLGRPLRSSRVAISRMLPGGTDDKGRPTIEVVTIIVDAADVGTVARNLPRWANDIGFWRTARAAAANGLEPPAAAGAVSTPTEASVRAFDLWIAARAKGAIGVLPSDASGRLLELVGQLAPTDQARCRWGIGLLSISAPVDLCTTVPGVALVGARETIKISTVHYHDSRSYDVARLVLQEGRAFPESSSVRAIVPTYEGLGRPAPQRRAPAQGHRNAPSLGLIASGVALAIAFIALLIVLLIPGPAGQSQAAAPGDNRPANPPTGQQDSALRDPVGDDPALTSVVYDAHQKPSTPPSTDPSTPNDEGSETGSSVRAEGATQPSKPPALLPLPAGDPEPAPGSGSTAQPANQTQQPAPGSDGDERGGGKEQGKRNDAPAGSSPSLPPPAQVKPPNSRRSHRVSSGAVDGVDELRELSTQLAMLRSLPEKGTRQLDGSWGAPKLDTAALVNTLWEVRELDWRLKEDADGLRGAARLKAGGFIRGDSKGGVLLRDPVSLDESLTEEWDHFLSEWSWTREKLLGGQPLRSKDEREVKAEIERATKALKITPDDKVSQARLAAWMEFFILPNVRTGVTEQRTLIDAERARAAEEAKKKQEREERERREKRERQGEEQ